MVDSLKKITIVSVCDNNYAILLGALMKSIEMNIDSSTSVDYYVIEDNINAKNKSKLERSVNRQVINISWLKMNDVIPKTFSLPTDTSTYPLNIYVRLFIPYFLPQNLNRVIYLDVDMIVLGNIDRLWNVDLNGEIIGAVKDTFGSAYYGIPNYLELGIPAECEYFNSGLLVIDCRQWRAAKITSILIDCLERNKSYAKYPDQYALNVVLFDKWSKLDSKWNTYTYEKELDPYLIHYIGYKPIFRDYDGNSEYLDQFYHYLNLTPWKGFRPKSKYVRYFSKLKTKIKKILPSNY